MKPILLFLLLSVSVLQGATERIQSINVDTEVARVRKQIQEIQGQPIGRDAKSQKQRELLDREIAAVKAQILGLENEIANAMKKGSDAKTTKESTEAAQERRKAALANLQKYLDILRSMNPKI